MIVLKTLTILGRLWLKSQGVRIGNGGWVHGFPSVRTKGGAQIHIGNNVSLCSMSRFNPLAPRQRLSFVTNTPTARIVVKDGAGISNSVLSCSQAITIGAHTMIGAECLIMDSDFHGFPLDEDKPPQTSPVEIGDYAFVGARCIILKGVKIGQRSVVGAGSVVSDNVPDNCLAAGNPAKVIRTFSPLA